MANARELVLKGLYQVAENGAYSNHVLQEILDHPGLASQDKGFAAELFAGVIRNLRKLDYIIAQFSKVKLKKLSPWVHQILRMGVYQLVCMDHVPDSAACNESVKLARRYAHGAAQGYVNGLLRNISRNKTDIVYPKDPVERMGVMESCPDWLTQRLVSQYGMTVCEEILKASHRKQPVSLRVNTLKTTGAELVQRLQKEGIVTRIDASEPRRLLADGAVHVGTSPAYREGLYTLQNSSSMAAVTALSPMPGEKVLDLCAAPGGKTTMMAEIMENRGRILALDIYPHKTALIEKAAKRLGITMIETKVWDAGEKIPEWEGRADRVLADVPCSGIGVIHKKPDIKWRRTPEDITVLCGIQKRILETAACYVRPEGILVYSTCTILQEENQMQIAAFLKKHPDFTLESEQLLQTYQTGGSGFYIAKLCRKG